MLKLSQLIVVKQWKNIIDIKIYTQGANNKYHNNREEVLRKGQIEILIMHVTEFINTTSIK